VQCQRFLFIGRNLTHDSADDGLEFVPLDRRSKVLENISKTDRIWLIGMKNSSSSKRI
jgi:hypothetical protein